MYGEDGVNVGYITNSAEITSINKISDSEVKITVNINRITQAGDLIVSTWSGVLVKKGGSWVDNGEFVQKKFYNSNTGETTSLE